MRIRFGRSIAVVLAALAVACGERSHVARPEKARAAAKELARVVPAPPPPPTFGYVFAPEPSRPEEQEPPAYMLDYCQPPTGGRHRLTAAVDGAYPPAARTTLFYRDTATLLHPAFRCVIRDEDDWTEIQVLGRLVVDKTVILDFRREMVLLAGTGSKTSGGYDVRFDSIVIRRDTLWAFVGSQSPPPGAVLAAEPFSAVEVRRIPRFDGTVVFVEESIPLPPPPQPLGKAPKPSATASSPTSGRAKQR